MKNLNSLLCAISLSLALMQPSTNAHAKGEGGWSGSGGDGTSSLFRILCLNLAQAIQDLPYENVPGTEYEINWELFETACVRAEVAPALTGQTGTNGEPLWEDLRDSNGNPRTMTFHAYDPNNKPPEYSDLNGKIRIHGPRFKAELEHNEAGLFVLIAHEIFKVMGINDDQTGLSAKAFKDYDPSFLQTLSSRSERLKSLGSRLIQEMETTLEIRKMEAEASASTVDARIATANKLIEFINKQLSEVEQAILTEESRGLELAKQLDISIEKDWASYQRQAKALRAQMTEFANTLEKEMSNINMFAVFPSQTGRNVAAILRSRAVLVGARPIKEKSTETEWLDAQCKRLAENIEFNFEQSKVLRDKKQKVVNRLVDVEIERF